MRGFLAILYVFTHVTVCRFADDFVNHTTMTLQNQLSTTANLLDETSTDSIHSRHNTPTEATTHHETRMPHYLRLGNQTVDINKSFKVPPLETSTKEMSSNTDDNGFISKPSETSVGHNISHIKFNMIGNKSVEVDSNNIKSNTSSVVIINNSSKGSLVTARPNILLSGNIGSARSWQGTKHEHEGRYGPRFEDGQGDHNTTIVVQAGDTAILDCRVSLLRDKTVSWVRRKVGEAPLLLTVGAQTYTGDSRYTVQFRYPGNWRLQLVDANRSDEGLYECQLSTHPPRVISIYLHVNTLQVAIVDESGAPLREQYYEAGSTLSLNCLIRGEFGDHSGSTSVWWLHGTNSLHRDAVRGGVGVKTEAVPAGANSTLRVNKLSPSDAGNYTCTVPAAPNRAHTVLVHVLNESLAELQQGSCSAGPRSFFILLAIALMVALSSILDAPV